jgi:hypothetical protein
MKLAIEEKKLVSGSIYKTKQWDTLSNTKSTSNSRKNDTKTTER